MSDMILKRSASEASSTIANLDGRITSLRQTVDSMSSLVSTLNGQVASLIQQTAQMVAVSLSDARVNSNFQLRITDTRAYSLRSGSGLQSYGLQAWYNGSYYGGLSLEGLNGNMSNPNLALYSAGMLWLTCHNYMTLHTFDNNHFSYIGIDLDADYAVGKRIRATEAITVDSDELLKQDIAEIDQGEALFDLIRERQYRMKAAPDCLHYGYIAQNVKTALERLGIPETVMLSDAVKEDGYMGLNYQEFIALTAHKVRCMEARYKARLDALERRVAALEGGAR